MKLEFNTLPEGPKTVEQYLEQTDLTNTELSVVIERWAKRCVIAEVSRQTGLGMMDVKRIFTEDPKFMFSSENIKKWKSKQIRI